MKSAFGESMEVYKLSFQDVFLGTLTVDTGALGSPQGRMGIAKLDRTAAPREITPVGLFPARSTEAARGCIEESCPASKGPEQNCRTDLQAFCDFRQLSHHIQKPIFSTAGSNSRCSSSDLLFAFFLQFIRTPSFFSYSFATQSGQVHFRLPKFLNL